MVITSFRNNSKYNFFDFILCQQKMIKRYTSITCNLHNFVIN